MLDYIYNFTINWFYYVFLVISTLILFKLHRDNSNTIEKLINRKLNRFWVYTLILSTTLPLSSIYLNNGLTHFIAIFNLTLIFCVPLNSLLIENHLIKTIRITEPILESSKALKNTQ